MWMMENPSVQEQMFPVRMLSMVQEVPQHPQEQMEVSKAPEVEESWCDRSMTGPVRREPPGTENRPLSPLASC